MATVVPIHYITLMERDGKQIPYIAGTRFRVSDIVIMHVHGDSPIDWIIENYEVLSYAKVYAALAYYYDHIEEIEAELAEPEVIPPGAIDSTAHIAMMRARLQQRQQNDD